MSEGQIGLLVHNIRAIENFNEFTCHLLDCMSVHHFKTAGPAPIGAVAGGAMSSSYGHGGQAMAVSGVGDSFSNLQSAVRGSPLMTPSSLTS